MAYDQSYFKGAQIKPWYKFVPDADLETIVRNTKVERIKSEAFQEMLDRGIEFHVD